MRESKSNESFKLKGLLGGFRKYFGGQAKVTVAGTDYTPDEIMGTLQGGLDAMDATSKAYAAWRAAVAREQKAVTQARALRKRVARWVRGMYEGRHNVLLEFGMKAAKVGKKTLQVKKVAAEKGKETRKARHTMGKRQKAKIKG